MYQCMKDKLDITIYRVASVHKTIVGCLSVNGLAFCDTSEHADRVLPEGTYKLVMKRDRRLGCRVPAAGCKVSSSACRSSSSGCKVSSSACRMIGFGNGVYGWRSCFILVGTRETGECLIHSRVAFAALCEKVKLALREKRQVWLTIVDERELGWRKGGAYEKDYGNHSSL